MAASKYPTNKKQAVFGIYDSRFSVEAAVESLKNSGFRHSDISVLLPEMGDTQRFAHEKNTKAPEGTATGVTTGAVVGGSLGWLAGIGLLTIPGAGPFIAAGPIMAALAGVGVGGAVGGVTGGLIGMGIPEFEAKRYESIVKNGGILISVHVDNNEWEKKARNILEATGANDVACVSEVGSSKDATKDTPRKSYDETTPIF